MQFSGFSKHIKNVSSIQAVCLFHSHQMGPWNLKQIEKHFLDFTLLVSSFCIQLFAFWFGVLGSLKSGHGQSQELIVMVCSSRHTALTKGQIANDEENANICIFYFFILYFSCPGSCWPNLGHSVSECRWKIWPWSWPGPWSWPWTWPWPWPFRLVCSDKDANQAWQGGGDNRDHPDWRRGGGARRGGRRQEEEGGWGCS